MRSTATITRASLALLSALTIAVLAGCGGAPAASQPTAVPATVAPALPSAAPAADATPPAGMPAIPTGPAGVMPAMVPAATAAPTFKDLAYANVSATQKLDLYIPAGSGPFPVVVSIHGGGFMMGDKADPMGAAGVDQLLAAGYAIAVTNYRLSSEALAPAQIQDIKAAVRWLRANATQYKLDAQHIAAWGGSAGGSLAALLGTSCGEAALEGADLGNADQSSCVQAVADWFGPIDFLQMDTQFAGTSCPQTHDAADSPESTLLGAAIQSVPDKAKQVSALTYVSAKAPPFFIQHGSADCNVPPQQSQVLHDALAAAIGADKVTLTLIPGAGHGGAEFMTDANMKLLTDFLGTYLK